MFQLNLRKLNLRNKKSRTFSTIALCIISAILVLTHLLPVLNFLLLPVFGFGLYTITCYQFSHKIISIGTWLITLLFGFFIAIYRPNDFNYPLLWHTSQLFEGGQAFSLYANISKALGGYLIILWLFYIPNNPTLNSSSHSKNATIKISLMVSTLAIISVIGIANVFFNISWQPKIPDGIAYFIIVNLCVTVVAEEAFFRLLIQQHIASFFTHKRTGMLVGIIASTVLFALAHGASSSFALLLFLIAGAVYSVVYAYTRRLSAAIITHFGVNILHFLLLEYPLSV